jgi:transcriptional regulator with XRE-family HTH domain
VLYCLWGYIMIDEKVIEELREYLKDNYTPSHDSISLSLIGTAAFAKAVTVKPFRNISSEASEYIKKNRKAGGFSYALDQKRLEKGLSPAELYKRANVDRRQYSKYMGPERKHPSMNTAISFALALRLERPEFDEFLQIAGYSLSNASSRDVCIMYCLEKGIYDIDEANALLFAVGIEPLSRE